MTRVRTAGEGLRQQAKIGADALGRVQGAGRMRRDRQNLAPSNPAQTRGDVTRAGQTFSQMHALGTDLRRQPPVIGHQQDQALHPAQMGHLTRQLRPFRPAMVTEDDTASCRQTPDGFPRIRQAMFVGQQPQLWQGGVIVGAAGLC